MEEGAFTPEDKTKAAQRARSGGRESAVPSPCAPVLVPASPPPRPQWWVVILVPGEPQDTRVLGAGCCPESNLSISPKQQDFIAWQGTEGPSEARDTFEQ